MKITFIPSSNFITRDISHLLQPEYFFVKSWYCIFTHRFVGRWKNFQPEKEAVYNILIFCPFEIFLVPHFIAVIPLSGMIG